SPLSTAPTRKPRPCPVRTRGPTACSPAAIAGRSTRILPCGAGYHTSRPWSNLRVGWTARGLGGGGLSSEEFDGDGHRVVVDDVSGAGQNGQLATGERAVQAGAVLDGAERVPVANQDERGCV